MHGMNFVFSDPLLMPLFAEFSAAADDALDVETTPSDPLGNIHVQNRIGSDRRVADGETAIAVHDRRHGFHRSLLRIVGQKRQQAGCVTGGNGDLFHAK